MKQDALPELLIFEPDPRGHAFEWLQHLVHHAALDRSPIRLSLAVPRPLAERIGEWMAETGLHNAELRPLSDREYALCMHRRLVVSGFARWWTMRRHLARSRAPQGLFLGIDHLSLPLAAGLRFGGRKVSGILFRPSVHYETDGPRRKSLGEHLRDIRKDILYRLMFRNAAVKAVFSLDPYFPDYGVKHYKRGHKIQPLPDPAFPRRQEQQATGLRNPFPPGRTSFLLFGVLTERKGILVLLDALKSLRPEIAERTAVLIAGAVDPAIRAAVTELQTTIGRMNPGLWLHIDDRHLATDELAFFTRSCDVVLAPYQRFVGSSGVLLWAASAGKPVITQGYGLLGKFARDFHLGTTCETTSPAGLSAAIEGVVLSGAEGLCDPCGIARFLTGRTPEAFSSRLFGTIFAGGNAASADGSVESRALHWSRPGLS